MTLSKHQFGDLIPKLEKRHGDSFSDVVNAFAHGTPDNPDADFTIADNLPISRDRVSVSNLPNYHRNNDERMKSAVRGYQNNPASVPPILLVKRAGNYEIADGHHRIAAARTIGKKSLPAWVVHSPLSEPYPDANE